MEYYPCDRSRCSLEGEDGSDPGCYISDVLKRRVRGLSRRSPKAKTEERRGKLNSGEGTLTVKAILLPRRIWRDAEEGINPGGIRGFYKND